MAEEIVEVVRKEKEMDKPEPLGQAIKQDGNETRKILSRIEKNLAGSAKVIKATRVSKPDFFVKQGVAVHPARPNGRSSWDITSTRMCFIRFPTGSMFLPFPSC